VRTQNADGGWGPAPGARSSTLYTATAVQGLAAAGRRPARSANGLLARQGARTRDIGELERIILGLVAGRGNPRRASGRDLVAALARRQRGNGSFNGQVLHTSFAILSLRAAGRRASNRAIRRAATFVARQQNGDGGFGFLTRGTQSGVDETGAAVQALVAAGRSRHSRAVRRAATFLARRQNPDGGFPLTRGAGSNAQSTAWAVQGFLAAGRNPSRVRRHGSRSALAYLRSLVGSNGSVRYSRISRQTPVWVTGQALQALAGRSLPIHAPRR
jgi:energy-coupling factor transport system substrate-specific component